MVGGRRHRPGADRAGRVVARLRPRASATYVIGAKPFTEQYVLAALIEQRLAAQGLSARSAQRARLQRDLRRARGQRDRRLCRLLRHDLGQPDEPHATSSRAREVLAEVGALAADATHGIRMLGALGFENAYALAMPREAREALGIRSIADLAAHARRADDRRRLRILRAAGMEGVARRLRPALPRPAHHAAGLHVSGRRGRRRRRDLGLYQRRPHRAIRSRRARRSEAGDPALRRHPAALAQARQRRGADRRARSR